MQDQKYIKKLYKPQNSNSSNKEKPSFSNKSASTEGISSDMFPVILIVAFVFFMILAAVIISTNPGKKQPVIMNDQKDKSNLPSLEKRSERSLPEGKMADWAKAVTYIETGYVQDGTFYGEKCGSGFVISEDGRIMTNNHVIEGGAAFLITYFDGTAELAEVMLADAELDMAILKSKLPSGVQALKLSEQEVNIGRKILVMGFPLGSKLGSEMTLTDGLISSVRKNEDGMTIWYQINAAINPGNSGGPLLDANNGEVLGIVTAKITEAENIGFARPISLVQKRMEGIN